MKTYKFLYVYEDKKKFLCTGNFSCDCRTLKEAFRLFFENVLDSEEIRYNYVVATDVIVSKKSIS